jgi:hypothetical protein
MGSYVIPDSWSDFRCTNTLYYDNATGEGVADGICQAIAAVYAAEPVGGFTFGQIEVRGYEFRGVARTGPPIAVRRAMQGGGSVPGPREVAVALSYRAGASTPRTRGRIFLGPVSNFSIDGEYVNQGIAESAKRIGRGLLEVRTGDARWSLYSRRDNALKEITNFSVDNAWDTQRSRGLPPTRTL